MDKHRLILSDLLGYADNIIAQTPAFKDFCISCVDHLGERVIPYLKSAYSSLRFLVPQYVGSRMDSLESLYDISDEMILGWYAEFKEAEAKREIEKEFKDNIDELQFLVRQYRNSGEFKEMLEFIGRFPHLAPYNAMLVQMQLPGARLVLNGKNWAYYNRRPKKNARCLITLMNFGPVQCMFEYGDTEPIPGTTEIQESRIFERWDKLLRSPDGEPEKGEVANLHWNLSQLGICLDTSFEAVNTYGGYLARYQDGEVTFHVNDKCVAKTKSSFIISVNGKADSASRFHTICHELGHLFCRHLYYDRQKERKLTTQQREFEAETVAWLVCKRRGIANPSEAYLSTYAPKGEIPVCSTDMILKAVTKIESLLTARLNIKASPWYEKNRHLRSLVETVERDLSKPRNLFNYK